MQKEQSGPPGDPRHNVALAIRMAERAGLFDMNGHISLRLPAGDQILINSHGASRRTLGPDDIITLDLQGNVLAGQGRPPSEWPLHTEIYRARADVGAVVHYHPPVATRFAICRLPLVPVCNLGSGVGRVAHCDLPDLIRTPDQGARVAADLGPHRAVLMRGHGATVVGADLREAFALAVYLEFNAQMLAGALAIGTPTEFTEEEIERIGATHREPRVLQKVWDYHLSKLDADHGMA